MNEKPKNRSVLRTQAALKTGLEELMQQKPVQQITVKELTDYVNLNRGTFYLHYQDIYDLLEQMETEMLEKFRGLVTLHRPEVSKGRTLPLLKDIFLFFGERGSFCRALLGDHTDYTFVQKMKQVIRENCFDANEGPFRQIPPNLHEAIYSYVLSGCIGIIDYWLFHNPQKSAGEVTSLAESLIVHGLDAFIRAGA